MGHIPSPADFIDSVGVNTHLGSDPYKSAFAVLRDRIGASGIKHLRDEIRPTNDLERWRDLHRSFGVKSHLLVSPSTNTVPQMLDYVSKLGVERISAIEGQNEGDSDWFIAQPAARGDWSAAVVDYQKGVWQSLRQHYRPETLPVVSPTVLNYRPHNMLLIGAAAPYTDVVAIHSYPQHAQEPETDESYAALAWYLKNFRDPFKPGAPVMVTETGYNDQIRRQSAAVSEAAASVYLPRMLLFNFASGIRRTFLYEFMDGGTAPAEWEHHFGLLRNDGTPKQSFFAIANLLTAMQCEADENVPTDNGGLGELLIDGRPLETNSGKLRSVAFRVSSSRMLVAVWLPARVWDAERARDIPVSPVAVSISAGAPLRRADFLVPNDSSQWSPLVPRASTVTIPVGAKVILVRLDAAP